MTRREHVCICGHSRKEHDDDGCTAPADNRLCAGPCDGGLERSFSCGCTVDSDEPCPYCWTGRKHEPVSIEYSTYIEVRCGACDVLWPCGGREQADVRTLLDVYDRVLDDVIVAHEQVGMDTPEDKALHARAVQEFRAAQRRLREARRG